MIFKDPHILSSDITPQTVFEDRRTWLKTAAMGSMALGLGSWLEREAFAKTPIAKEKLAAKFNEQYSTKETATSYERLQLITIFMSSAWTRMIQPNTPSAYKRDRGQSVLKA